DDNFGQPGPYAHNCFINNMMPYMGKLYLTTYGTMSYTSTYPGPKVYSSPDGVTWTKISNSTITKTANWWVESVEPYKGNLYFSTYSPSTGTQVIKGKVE
ncbi:MAG: hypothetical protein Q7S42_00230, partial [Candidatus Omnitrophota bacterium]|nr:hypothetical protein [Candidatus Omnitrophota bacterium]